MNVIDTLLMLVSGEKSLVLFYSQRHKCSQLSDTLPHLVAVLQLQPCVNPATTSPFNSQSRLCQTYKGYACLSLSVLCSLPRKMSDRLVKIVEQFKEWKTVNIHIWQEQDTICTPVFEERWLLMFVFMYICMNNDCLWLPRRVYLQACDYLGSSQRGP